MKYINNVILISLLAFCAQTAAWDIKVSWDPKIDLSTLDLSKAKLDLRTLDLSKAGDAASKRMQDIVVIIRDTIERTVLPYAKTLPIQIIGLVGALTATGLIKKGIENGFDTNPENTNTQARKKNRTYLALGIALLAANIIMIGKSNQIIAALAA